MIYFFNTMDIILFNFIQGELTLKLTNGRAIGVFHDQELHDIFQHHQYKKKFQLKL